MPSTARNAYAYAYAYAHIVIFSTSSTFLPPSATS